MAFKKPSAQVAVPEIPGLLEAARYVANGKLTVRLVVRYEAMSDSDTILIQFLAVAENTIDLAFFGGTLFDQHRFCHGAKTCEVEAGKNDVGVLLRKLQCCAEPYSYGRLKLREFEQKSTDQAAEFGFSVLGTDHTGAMLTHEKSGIQARVSGILTVLRHRTDYERESAQHTRDLSFLITEISCFDPCCRICSPL